MPEIRAAIAYVSKDGGSAFVGIQNTGDVDWGDQDVAYRVDVSRDGTHVQSEGGNVAGIPAGGQFDHTFSFLGESVPGTYAMHCFVVETLSQQTIAEQTVDVEVVDPNPAPPSNAGRALVGDVTVNVDGGTIHTAIRNASDVDWQHGDVVFELVVQRADDGTQVQYVNDHVGALAMGAYFTRQDQFLGTAPGEYLLAVNAVNQHDGSLTGSGSSSTTVA
jgi:hypothetical protein